MLKRRKAYVVDVSDFVDKKAGTKRIAIILSLFYMLLSAAPFAVSAQEEDTEEGAFMLEEITVTAEKQESSLQKTSIAIEVKDGAQLVLEGKTRIDDIMRGTVGVAAQSSSTGLNFTIRGITSSQGDPPGSSIRGSSIPVLMDGIAQDRSEAVRGGTLDTSRVEVMRGPQGTNVGANALLGAVSLVTNDPVFRYESSGSLEIGNYNLVTSQGVVNVPLSDETALRFAASTNKRDGYVSSNAGESDLLNARVKYRWQPAEELNIVLTGNFQKIGGNGINHGGVLAEGRWVAYDPAVVEVDDGYDAVDGTIVSGIPPEYMVEDDGSNFRTRSDAWDDGFPKDGWTYRTFAKTEVNIGNAVIDWDTPIGSLRVLPSYQESDYHMSKENQNIWTDQESFQIEANLASTDTSSLEWLAGVYYYDTDRAYTTVNVDYKDYLTTYSWTSTKSATQRTLSAYANGKYSVIEALRLIGGIRYSNDKKGLISDTGGMAGMAGDASGPYTDFIYNPESTHTWTNADYRAGIEYDVSAGAMMYGAVSTGYRPGNLNYSNFTDTISTTEALDLTQYSLGIKSRFLENRLQTNIEAFYSTFENQAIEGDLAIALSTADDTDNYGFPMYPPGLSPALMVGENGDVVIISNGSATTTQVAKGVDFDIEFVPTSNDRINLSVERLSSKYTERPSISGSEFSATVENLMARIENPTGDAAENLAELAPEVNEVLDMINGATLQNSPKWSLSASYQHSFNLPNGSTVVPRFDAYYKSEYWSWGNTSGVSMQSLLNGEVGLAFQPDHWTYDFYTNWYSADGKLSVTGYIKNIADEVVMTNYTGDYVTLDPPRTMGIILTAKW